MIILLFSQCELQNFLHRGNTEIIISMSIRMKNNMKMDVLSTALRKKYGHYHNILLKDKNTERTIKKLWKYVNFLVLSWLIPHNYYCVYSKKADTDLLENHFH